MGLKGTWMKWNALASARQLGVLLFPFYLHFGTMIRWLSMTHQQNQQTEFRMINWLPLNPKEQVHFQYLSKSWLRSICRASRSEISARRTAMTAGSMGFLLSHVMPNISLFDGVLWSDRLPRPALLAAYLPPMMIVDNECNKIDRNTCTWML